MKPRVILTRPRRTYSNLSADAVLGPSSQGKAVEEEDKKAVGKGRVNYPSIEGVIINPLPDPVGAGRQNKVDDLLAAAMSLPMAERKLLLARLAMGNQPEKPGDRELEMWSLGVQMALKDAIGSEAGAAHGLLVIKRLLASPSSWGPVAEFMTAAGFTELTVVHKQSAYIMLARLLVRYASSVSRRMDAPLTPKFVANCAQHVAAVFENAFPGYVAAGLAPLVAGRLVEEKI